MTVLRKAFETVIAGRSLEAGAAQQVIGEMLDGGAPDPLVAGFLVALKVKGETAPELIGGARAMRARARALDLQAGPILDTCGTGGDGLGTFSISTGAALIAAAAGLKVAKHGNRAASGIAGAADALEYLGVPVDLDPDGLRQCLDRCGFCFVFAPAYHPAMKRVADLRRALGIRTLFNLLGPLANPARPERHIVGVPEPRLVAVLGAALAALGVEHAMVVHGQDGMDEISISASTRIAEVRGERVREYQVTPESFGIGPTDTASLKVSSAAQSVDVLLGALGGKKGPARDVLALNGGAAIYVGGGADSFEKGVLAARAILESGSALKIVEKLRAASRENSIPVASAGRP